MDKKILESLKLKDVEGFKKNLSINFSKNINLLLGINGSGKTTILEFISMLLSFDWYRWRKKNFNFDFRMSIESKDITWEGSIEYSVPNQKIDLNKIDDDVKQFFSFLIYIRDGEDNILDRIEYNSIESKLITGIDKNNHNFYSDSLDLRTYVRETDDKSQFKKQLSIYKHPKFRVGDEEYFDFTKLKFSYHKNSFDSIQGRLDQFLSIAGHIASISNIKDGFEIFLPECPDFLNSLKAEKFGLLVDVDYSEGKNSKVHISNPRVYLSINGKKFANNDLTFGQRRILMIMLLIIGNENAIPIIDEITNGFHPRIIESIVKNISSRQSFISSHHHYVIDLLNLEKPEDITKSIHILERVEGLTQIKEISKKAAVDIFEKVSTNFIDPSDLLLHLGLW